VGLVCTLIASLERFSQKSFEAHTWVHVGKGSSARRTLQ
jgi:hypothetical protein